MAPKEASWLVVGCHRGSSYSIAPCAHLPPTAPLSIRVTSDRRSGRTEDKTPAELCEFIGCCCGRILHIRGALCCQARFQSRALTAFISPQHLVIKAAARGKTCLHFHSLIPPDCQQENRSCRNSFKSQPSYLSVQSDCCSDFKLIKLST